MRPLPPGEVGLQGTNWYLLKKRFPSPEAGLADRDDWGRLIDRFGWLVPTTGGKEGSEIALLGLDYDFKGHAPLIPTG